MRRSQSEKKNPEVRHISDLFAVYKKRLQAPEQSVLQEVVSVIQEVVGISITTKQCRYNARTRTVSLQVSGMIKDQVFIKTPEIITILEKRLGQKNCPNSII